MLGPEARAALEEPLQKLKERRDLLVALSHDGNIEQLNARIAELERLIKGEKDEETTGDLSSSAGAD